jgi:hypothetical protein
VTARAWLLLGLAACAGGARRAPAVDDPAPASTAPAPRDVTITPGAPLREPAVDPRVALLAGLMPLRSTGVPDFLAAHPT